MPKKDPCVTINTISRGFASEGNSSSLERKYVKHVLVVMPPRDGKGLEPFSLEETPLVSTVTP